MKVSARESSGEFVLLDGFANVCDGSEQSGMFLAMNCQLDSRYIQRQIVVDESALHKILHALRFMPVCWPK